MNTRAVEQTLRYGYGLVWIPAYNIAGCRVPSRLFLGTKVEGSCVLFLCTTSTEFTKTSMHYLG